MNDEAARKALETLYAENRNRLYEADRDIHDYRAIIESLVWFYGAKQLMEVIPVDALTGHPYMGFAERLLALIRDRAVP